ncbi:hypothetical protein Tco_0424870 [Tanacetum coccineum]
MSLRTTVLGQQALIRELQATNRMTHMTIIEMLAANRRRQAQFIKALKLLKRLQTQMTKTTRLTPVIETTNTTSVTNAQLKAMIDQCVIVSLAARDANTNGEDSHNSGIGVRRTERVAQECTYQDFMKCQPLFFKGTKGVVELMQWFERMETVFRISNCSVEN